MAQPEKAKYVREKASATFHVPPPVARISLGFPWKMDIPIQEAVELHAQLTVVMDEYAKWFKNQGR